VARRREGGRRKPETHPIRSSYARSSHILLGGVEKAIWRRLESLSSREGSFCAELSFPLAWLEGSNSITRRTYTRRRSPQRGTGWLCDFPKDRLSCYRRWARRFQIIQNGRSRESMVESYPFLQRARASPLALFRKGQSVESATELRFGRIRRADPLSLQVPKHPRENAEAL